MQICENGDWEYRSRHFEEREFKSDRRCLWGDHFPMSTIASSSDIRTIPFSITHPIEFNTLSCSTLILMILAYPILKRDIRFDRVFGQIPETVTIRAKTDLFGRHRLLCIDDRWLLNVLLQSIVIGSVAFLTYDVFSKWSTETVPSFIVIVRTFARSGTQPSKWKAPMLIVETLNRSLPTFSVQQSFKKFSSSFLTLRQSINPSWIRYCDIHFGIIEHASECSVYGRWLNVWDEFQQNWSYWNGDETFLYTSWEPSIEQSILLIRERIIVTSSRGNPNRLFNHQMISSTF